MKIPKGQFITVPTETVEGFAARLDDETAIKSLMEYKERDFDSGKVFTLVPESKDSATSYALLSPLARQLIDQYFPGELTLILSKNPNFHHFYYDHFNSIGLRLPNHPTIMKLLQENGPLILTSANRKGKTPKSSTGHLPSTILDLTSKTPKLLRQGNLIVDFLTLS